jgi:hypothetical protein
MSKLIQRIERLGKDTPAPLGFGAASRRQVAPTMVLLASTADPKAATQLKGISLDGVLFTPGTVTASALAKAASGLTDVPWGAQVQSPTTDQVKELVDAGCDFITVTGMSASLEALHNEDLGKFLVVSPDLKEEHAHSMEVMPIDAVVYSDAVSSPLDLQSLLQLASDRGEIGSAFLLPVKGSLTTWELECLREIGVEGVIVDLASTDVASITALVQAIAELPRRRSRTEMSSPSLPRVSARAQVQDDDDDDDDYPESPDDLS